MNPPSSSSPPGDAVRSALVTRLRDGVAIDYGTGSTGDTEAVMDRAADLLESDGRALAAKAGMPEDVAKHVERLRNAAHVWRVKQPGIVLADWLDEAADLLAATSARADEAEAELAALKIKMDQVADAGLEAFDALEAAEAKVTALTEALDDATRILRMWKSGAPDRHAWRDAFLAPRVVPSPEEARKQEQGK